MSSLLLISSPRNISYIIFELQFLDTERDGPMMVYRGWSAGINPNVQEVLRNREPLALSPGDRATLTLSGKEIGKIKNFLALRQYELSEMQNTNLTILYLLFEDGIKWETGHYFRPNPKAESGYELINQRLNQ